MRGLQLSACVALLAACAANASLLNSEPDYALILSRQAPGTPQFECHSNCGNVIAGARVSGYCDNSTWVGFYEACLDCALDFDIWRFYGNGVGNAATACGLTAVPSPSGDAASPPTSTPSETPSSSPSSTAESGSSGISPSVAPSTTGSGSAAPSDSATTTPPPTSGTETAASNPSTTSSVTTAGAPGVNPLGSLVSVGALVAVFVMLLGPW